MLQNLYMYTGAFIREWRAGRNHLYLLDQETINLWRINTTKGSGVVKSEEVTQDIRAKGKRLVGGVLSWLSGLIRVWLQQKGKISALGRKWGAFPTFTASLLPSIRHNFYVKEAYLGVTKSHDLQGSVLSSAITCIFHKVWIIFLVSFCFFLLGGSGSIWDLSSWFGGQTQAPLAKVLSPNHWTSREFPF